MRYCLSRYQIAAIKAQFRIWIAVLTLIFPLTSHAIPQHYQVKFEQQVTKHY